jgi:hypothetical protein
MRIPAPVRFHRRLAPRPAFSCDPAETSRNKVRLDPTARLTSIRGRGGLSNRYVERLNRRLRFDEAVITAFDAGMIVVARDEHNDMFVAVAGSNLSPIVDLKRMGQL